MQRQKSPCLMAALPPGKFLHIAMKFIIKKTCQNSGWSENFPDGLETFQMAWKLSDDLESVWMIWKLFGGSDNFQDGLKTY